MQALSLFLDPVIFLFAVVANIFIIETIKSFRPFRRLSDKTRANLYRVLAFVAPSLLIITNNYLVGYNLAEGVPYPGFVAVLASGTLSVLMYDLGGRNIVKYLKHKLFNTPLEYETDNQDNNQTKP